ncbi:MAG TPA: flagellar assembly protein FliH [Oxalicibacterium sp.]|jgi:flagellar assembly protein FliH|nr:flagellar assembly protein FliH [Oxalicibacterium sp.]
MSNVIPKEQQSAYQRWEMISLGEDKPRLGSLMQQADNSAHAAAAAAQAAALTAAVAEQGRQAREKAHAEGYAAGLEEGRAAGLAQGRATAERERQTLQSIAEMFGTEVAQANELIASDMLDLSLDLAKAMLKTALNVRPELIVPLVREAIHYLPTLQQPALLHLHPDDAAIVSQYMGDEINTAGWRIVEDTHMDRGGCRVETASNQIDASTPTRWQRLAAALGKDSDWLEP